MSPRFTIPAPLPLSGSLLRLSAVIIVVMLARPAQGRRQYDQFNAFFPSWQGLLRDIRDNNCSEQYQRYQTEEDPDQATTLQLINCMLENMDEFRKVEMGITAILLGLLPSVLQQVGPAVAEVSLLSLRRPVLAALLALGSPCVSVSRDNTFNNPVDTFAKTSMGASGDDADAKPRAITNVLERLHKWRNGSNCLMVVISVVEYLLGAAAVVNVVYQTYQLSYWSVSVSTIAVPALLPETYAPFLWTFLIIPVHLIGVVVITLRVDVKEGYGSDRDWKTIVQDELKPCVFGRPLSIEKQKIKKQGNEELWHHLRLLISTWLLFMGVWCYVIYGTVALSSQLFISLGDVCPIIARFVGGSIACRMVLIFELYAIRHITHKEKSEDEKSQEKMSQEGMSQEETSEKETSRLETSPV
ncbi:hypothetical protein DL770_011776 [Monosporascus sp. CRB-9-2]|nr:hypothetical protein DL770_011776 [Monosporascus sp. CRB-9-2]